MEIDISSLFKSMVWDVLLKRGIDILITSLSISPQGILAVIITKLIIIVANKLYPIIVQMVRIESVVLTDEVHQKSFERAQLKLKIIAKEKGIDSQEFKDAREKEKETLYKLIKFNDGSTSMRVG